MSDYKKMIDEIYEYVSRPYINFDYNYHVAFERKYLEMGKAVAASDILGIFDKHGYKKHLKDA